jgi:hypothetical protein
LESRRKKKGSIMLDHLVGLVKVRVVRGVNLAIRDLRSSDPYVVVRIGKQVRSSSSSPFWLLYLICCFRVSSRRNCLD